MESRRVFFVAQMRVFLRVLLWVLMTGVCEFFLFFFKVGGECF